MHMAYAQLTDRKTAKQIVRSRPGRNKSEAARYRAYENQGGNTSFMWKSKHRRFAQLEQANIGGNKENSNNHGNTEQVTGMQHTQIHSQEPTCITSTRSNIDQFEGNYPSTPTLNRLIIETDLGAQSNEKQEKSEVIKYKMTSRKFPAIDYSEINKCYQSKA
ncbi:hypothetical protein C2G38_2035045 [Gigaspora rosea]|uniref:Uncharacterized protein n=1 Tax=Gigaspora rosea TaxID=44941 RepID=A0A397VNA3_9GLOM|nr:hypothetical protein C2G38_2035045 [Gigaspora rosea]